MSAQPEQHPAAPPPAPRTAPVRLLPRQRAGDRVRLEPGRSDPLARSVLRAGVRPFLLAGDAGAVLAAALLVGAHGVQAPAVAAVFVLLVAQRRLHRSRLSLSLLDDLPALSGRLVAAGLGVLAAGVLLERPGLADPDVARLVAAGLPAVLLVRAVAYAAVRAARRRGVVRHRTVVLGAGRVGGSVATRLLEHPEYGLLPVGLLDGDPLLAPDEQPVPVLGGFGALEKVLVEFGVRDVVVAFGSLPESSLVDVIRTCDRLDCEVFLVPRLYEMQVTTGDMEDLWGMPLVRLRRAAFRRPSWHLKRLLDVVVSATALLLLSPVLAVCAYAVRREGGPGVLFRQTRIGLDGQPFDVLKLRSLRPVDETESQTRWNVALDDRLGPVGRFLRKTSLDELPQLWNILRGDMTLVGPRPERPHFVEQFSRVHARYTARHRVPAGLTGWAQVHGLRGDTSIEDRARFDNYYIENWSLWGDVKILLRTVSAVLLGRGG